MKLNYTIILESVKKMKSRDFIYPGVLIFFLIIVTVIFILATRFISENINNVFSFEESDKAVTLDIERYKWVAKKLNIVVNTQGEEVTTPETSTDVDISPTTTTEASTSTVSLDKSAITIMVINSTQKSGLAGELAKQLNAVGFSTPKTGTEKELYSTTTIFIKKSKYDYATLLLEAVLKSYAFAIATTTPETADFDATIIIGAQ